jgi:hypothetical protein
MSGSFWRVLLILVVVAILTSMLGAVIQAPFGLAGLALDFALDNSTHTQWIPTLLTTGLNAVGQTASGAILQPWSAAVVALLYIDLRMRREGLDLELIRAADAQTTTP